MYYVFKEGNYVIDGVGLSEEQKSKAVVVEELPTPQPPEGKRALLRADKKTDIVYYEYVDLPADLPVLEDLLLRITGLEAELAKLKTDTTKVITDVETLMTERAAK